MVLKLSIFWKILLLFALTQFLGIFVAIESLPSLGGLSPRDISGFSLTDILIVVVLAGVFILASFKFPRLGLVLFRSLLTIIVFSMTQMVLSLKTDLVTSTLGGLVLAVLFWLWPKVWLRNALMIITLAGLGAILGLALTPMSAVYILMIFSFYDILAVYKTGHMVKMADLMIRSKAVFGFIVPASVSDFGSKVDSVKPGESFTILGSGDAVLPLILAASLVRQSIGQALITAGFSLLGLFLTHLIFSNQKTKRPMAALPPIAAMTIIGYLASLI